MRDEDAILFANEVFYNAFQSRDLIAMETIWAVKAPLICVHPGGAPLHGRAAILASWAEILKHAASADLRFAEARAIIVDGVAFVSCFERIGGGALSATNAFVREYGRWRMVLHHAGSCAEVPQFAPDNGENRGALH